MALSQIILWLVVVAIGLPSAWRNPTAATLVFCYFFSQAVYLWSGNGLAVEFYAYPDAFVIAVIFAKPRYKPCEDYWDLGTWEQLKCILTERTPSDRFVMLSYLPCWVLYVCTLNAYYVYWALFYISIAQFLAAGWESLFFHLRRHAETMNRPPADPGALLVAYPGGGRF